jgi:flagellar biosynthesis/type III secretory pathway protein FliH
VAQSEPVRRRAFWELAVREAANERVDQAVRMLDRAEERCGSAASSEAIATWRAQLETLRHTLADRHAQREAAARQAYLERLREGYQQAVQQGDSSALAHYEQKLSAAGVPLE